MKPTTDHDNTQNLSTNIFAYSDYRIFLSDFVTEKKRALPTKFSHRYLSKKIGVGTPTFLHSVINGKRNLSLETVRKVADVIPLTGRPFEFFEKLVQFNQAKTERERTIYFEALKEFKEYIKPHTLQENQSEYLSHWCYPVIREMIRLPSFNPKPEWIAQRVRPCIDVARAQETLDMLLRLGLAVVDETGKWKQAEPRLTTPNQVPTQTALDYHKQSLCLSSQCLNQTPADRNVCSMLMPVSQIHFEIIRNKMAIFQKEMNGVLSHPLTAKYLKENNVDEDLLKDKSKSELVDVAQLNMQLFKVAKSKERT